MITQSAPRDSTCLFLIWERNAFILLHQNSGTEINCQVLTTVTFFSWSPVLKRRGKKDSLPATKNEYYDPKKMVQYICKCTIQTCKVHVPTVGIMVFLKCSVRIWSKAHGSQHESFHRFLWGLEQVLIERVAMVRFYVLMNTQSSVPWSVSAGNVCCVIPEDECFLSLGRSHFPKVIKWWINPTVNSDVNLHHCLKKTSERKILTRTPLLHSLRVGLLNLQLQGAI